MRQGLILSSPVAIFFEVKKMTDGKHHGGFKYRNKRDITHHGRNSVIGTVITAIAGTIVKDLTNEDSKIKNLFNKIIRPKQIEEKQDERKVIDTEFSVIENEKIEKISSN